MAIQVLIKSVDRTKEIEWSNLKIQNILTNKIDKCSFLIRNYGTNNYHPILGNEVIITNNGVKIFGGIILSIEESPESFKIINYKVECVDYTRLLDGKLVSDLFENKTVNEIIIAIIDKYAPAGFTTINVNCTQIVEYIDFQYQTVSSCLKDLAELFNYDWYVDYYKDIHFFNKEENAAPFELNDDDGSYIYNSLVLRRDNSQIKNVVVVEGGEYLADTMTATYKCNGTDRIYNIGYKYDDLVATLSATSLKLGIDFSADPDDYDALWNQDEKIIKWKDDDKPSNGASLKIIGRPYQPVLVKKYNRESINAVISAEGGDGEYEYYINDPTINSKEGATERASAELYGYAQTITEGEFETENDGLKAGQRIHIVSDARDIDEYYIINKVAISMRTPEYFKYKVSLITTRTFGMIEILQKLLQNKGNKLSTNTRRILNLIEGANEFITIVESTPVISLSHNPVSESLSLSDSATVQALNYDVDWVVGDYAPPTDNKRTFLIEGSYLE